MPEYTHFPDLTAELGLVDLMGDELMICEDWIDGYTDSIRTAELVGYRVTSNPQARELLRAFVAARYPWLRPLTAPGPLDDD